MINKFNRVAGVISSLDPIEDSPFIGNDLVQVDLYGDGFSQDATQTAIPAYAANSDEVRFVGERVLTTVNETGEVQITSSVDDKMVQITAINASFKIGYYVGKMYSMGEIYRNGLIPTTDLKMAVPVGGIDVVIINTAEDQNLDSPSLPIIKFPILIPCKVVHVYTNGVIVVQIHYKAKNLAKITAASGTRTYSYTVQRILRFDSTQTLAKDKWITDGVNIINVTNRLELGGTATYTEGTGVSITNADGTVNSGTCKYVPLGIGAVVEIELTYDASFVKKYSFAQANSAQ